MGNTAKQNLRELRPSGNAQKYAEKDSSFDLNENFSQISTEIIAPFPPPMIYRIEKNTSPTQSHVLPTHDEKLFTTMLIDRLVQRFSEEVAIVHKSQEAPVDLGTSEKKVISIQEDTVIDESVMPMKTIRKENHQKHNKSRTGFKLPIRTVSTPKIMSRQMGSRQCHFVASGTYDRKSLKIIVA